MSTLEALYAIQRADPDGGERKPRPEDYAAHEAWARATFGDAAWNAYKVPGWGEARGPDYYHADAYDYSD